MAILLALLGAAAYGLSDFVGGVVSGRVSPWTVALCGQLAGGAVVLVVALGSDGSPTSVHLAWAAVAGAGNGLGTAFLYRGLASGRMGVVAPVSGVGAAVVPVVVGVVSDERPSALVWLGILTALPAIWLVARDPALDADRPDPGRHGSGLLDGVLAGLGFGVLFSALAQVPEEAGLLPLAFNQLVAAVVVVVVSTVLGAAWLPRSRWALGGVVSGVLGALATGAFLVASHGGYLSVTAVVVSLYPAFTVLLAMTVLREHVHRAQAIGLGLCGVAVVLVAVG